MDLEKCKLPGWVANLAASLGSPGILLVAFLDSSVLSLPVINDLLVIHLSIQNPGRMPLYAAMATLGSLAGSIVLYFTAKKGGEAYFKKHTGGRGERIRAWLDRNSFLAVAIPSILPPPMPFKAFVIAAGVFQIRIGTFVLALLVGRGMRYLVGGSLAVRHGLEAQRFVCENVLQSTAILVVLVLGSYVVTRLILRQTK